MTTDLERQCRRLKIRVSCEYGNAPPNNDFPGSTPWGVTLKRTSTDGKRKQMSLHFYTGSAWCTEPTVADVVSCLVSDAWSFENARDFEDWAHEYGFDTDSRKAEALYRKVQQQSRRFLDFLGPDLTLDDLNGEH